MSYFRSCHARFILDNCNLYFYIFYGEIKNILQLSQCPSVVHTFSHTCDVMILQQI